MKKNSYFIILCLVTFSLVTGCRSGKASIVSEGEYHALSDDGKHALLQTIKVEGEDIEYLITDLSNKTKTYDHGKIDSKNATVSFDSGEHGTYTAVKGRIIIKWETNQTDKENTFINESNGNYDLLQKRWQTAQKEDHATPSEDSESSK